MPQEGVLNNHEAKKTTKREHPHLSFFPFRFKNRVVELSLRVKGNMFDKNSERGHEWWFARRCPLFNLFKRLHVRIFVDSENRYQGAVAQVGSCYKASEKAKATSRSKGRPTQDHQQNSKQTQSNPQKNTHPARTQKRKPQKAQSKPEQNQTNNGTTNKPRTHVQIHIFSFQKIKHTNLVRGWFRTFFGLDEVSC